MDLLRSTNWMRQMLCVTSRCANHRFHHTAMLYCDIYQNLTVYHDNISVLVINTG